MSNSGQTTNDRPAQAVAPILLPPDRKAITMIGRYEIIRLLGEGAVGMVYIARDPGLNRSVALKVPTARFTEEKDDTALFRFYQDAHAASTLHHPNICKIYEVGQDGERHYIAMQFVEGRPLSDFVQPEMPLPTIQVAMIIRKLADAIEHAHQKGVVHKDLRPDNIVINDKREPIVMNFGLSTQEKQGADSRFTQSGMIAGSPSYLAPEQIESELGQVGPATDIYSLGVIFFELLTGRLPFDGTYDDVLKQILQNDPDLPSRLRRDVHPALDNLCLQMLSKRIDRRPKSMAEVAATLGQYITREKNESTEPAESKDQLAAFDKKQAVRDARSERLEQYKRHIMNLRKEGAYDTALRMLNQMAALQDPRFEEYSQWAREQIPNLRSEPERIAHQRSDAYDAAMQLMSVNDYHSAVKMLEAIPKTLRTPAITALLREANHLHTRCETLIRTIREGFKTDNTKRLLSKVEILLELRPGYEQAKEWYFKLTGRRYGAAPDNSAMPPVVFWPLAVLAVAAVVLVGVVVFKSGWFSFNLPRPPSTPVAGKTDSVEKTPGNTVDPGPGVVLPQPKPAQPQPNQPVAVLPEIKYGPAVDLLKLIDPKKNRIYGTWQFEGKDLTARSAAKGNVHFLQVPYQPPQEYEIRMTATQLANTEANPAINFGLVNGDKKNFLAILNERRTDNYLLKLPNENASSENKAYYKGELLKVDAKAEIVYRVMKSGVFVSVDGQEVADWKGDPKTLQCEKDLQPPDPTQLALKCHASYRISRMELRSINPDDNPQQPNGPVQTVDLLKLIDPEKHKIKGFWKLANGELQSQPDIQNADKYSFIQIPYKPPSEYDLTMVVTKLKSTATEPALLIGLVGGGRHFHAHLNYHQTQYGLWQLDDKLLMRQNESYRVGTALPEDKQMTIISRVTKSGVKVYVDGKIVIDWNGAFTRLNANGSHSPPNHQQLSLKTGWPYRFHKIELGPVGKGSPPTPKQPVAQQPQRKFAPAKYLTDVNKPVHSVWQISTRDGMQREILYDDGATENGQKWSIDGNDYSFGYDSAATFLDRDHYFAKGRWQRGAFFSARLQSRNFFLKTAETGKITVPSAYGASQAPADKQGEWSKIILDTWDLAAITNKKDKLFRISVNILADGRVVDGPNEVGTWKIQGKDKVLITFVDNRLGEVTFTPQSSRQLIGEKRGAEDWKLRLDRVQQVATMLIDTIGTLTFYSNARLNHPTEGSIWVISGANRDTIDIRTGAMRIARDGQTVSYEGVDNDKYSGRLISGSFR